MKKEEFVSLMHRFEAMKFVKNAMNEIEEVFNNREREMRLRIQKDLKKHGIDVVLIKEEKKYDA